MHGTLDERADVILVGGGLANSLIALRLRRRLPELRVLLFEKSPTPDVAHTWSFFQTDLAGASDEWIAPLTKGRWTGYDVCFPDYTRTLRAGYASIASEGLARAVQAALGAGLRRGAEVADISADGVRLADGRGCQAPLVIDGRGARPSAHMALAWQKFIGLEVRLQQPHGLRRPVVMDASVPQIDGFRFVYVLPLASDVVLIEDTRYSNGAELDSDALTGEIADYAARRSWRIAETLRREQGVLPLVLAGDIRGFWAEQDDGIPRAGMRAALFHPTTGYSLPDAVRLAEAVADAPSLDSASINRLVRRRSIALWRERAIFRGLNRMMFLAAGPERRFRVLQRFYRLPEPLIERFYAAQLRLADRVRLVVGEPPVPIGRALRALSTSAASIRAASAHA